MRLRTEVHVYVSRDQKHDTHMTQHAVRDWLEKRMATRCPWLKRLFIHSDGAPSHFKNKWSIHFLLDLKRELELAFLAWEFGAPQHGKGPFAAWP